MSKALCLAAMVVMLNCTNKVSAEELQSTEVLSFSTATRMLALFGKDPSAELSDLFNQTHRDSPARNFLSLRTRADVESFIEKLQNSTKQGDIASSRILGWIYHSPEFANSIKAVKYYSMAARAGDAVSARCMGDAYSSGDLGLEKDRACALGWYEIASNLGDTKAKAKELQVWLGAGDPSPFPERAFTLAHELSVQGDSEGSAWMAGIVNNPSLLRNNRRAFRHAIVSAKSGNRLGLGHLSQIVLEHYESLTKDELWQAYKTLKKCDYYNTDTRNAAFGLLQINNVGEDSAEIGEGCKRLLSASANHSSWASLRLAQAICEKKIGGSISDALRLTKLAANLKNTTACWILVKSRSVDKEDSQWLDEIRTEIGQIDTGLVRMVETLKRG